MADKNKVDDKKQEEYTIFVATGIKIANSMMKQIKPDPDSISTALSAIVSRLDAEGKKNGLEFDMAIRLHGSQEILSYILENLDMEVTEEIVKQIVGLAVGKYLQTALASGTITKEELAQLSQQQEQPQPEKQGLISGRQING